MRRGTEPTGYWNRIAKQIGLNGRPGDNPLEWILDEEVL